MPQQRQAGDMVMYGGNQALAVAHGVAERIEASNQEGRDAQPVVLAKRSGNLLGGAYQGGGVPARPGQPGHAGPQTAVEHFALLGSGQQALRTDVLRLVVAQRQTEARTVLADLFEHLGGTLPGGLLGIRDDRPE